ncbi:MAG TPA: response regulator [Candidatus Kryptonia bacterium]
MLFKKTQNIKSSAPTASENARQEIASHLRLADKFIKEGKYVDAREELDAVRAIDPNNVYALALEERRTALESAALKTAAAAEAPPTPEELETKPEVIVETPAQAPQVKPPELAKEVLGESAIRAEIEQRLESEYNKRFTDEIRKAEQRIAEALKKEREWQEAERASLIANLEKEKEKFRRELEKQSKEKFEMEIGKMEATYRQQLASERKKAEEETRSEMSALYEKSMLELKESAVREKKSLLDKERTAIEDSRRQMEAELDKRVSTEVEKMKASGVVEKEKESDQHTEVIRQRLQREYEEKLAANQRRIEEEREYRQREIERTYEDRYRKLEQQTQSELDKRLDELRHNERREFEQKQSELRRQLELEYRDKLSSELAAEREKVESRIERELKEHQSRIEGDRKKVVEEEQKKLDERRYHLRGEMDKELEKRILDAKSIAEADYEERLKLLGVKLPDTREEKLRLYMTRLREAWATPPVTPELARELMQLRDVLGLTFEDHLESESDIRLQVYVTEVEKEIRKGKIKPNDQSALEDLKHRFQITQEESTKLEPHILAAFQRAVMKAVILVVDDEPSFLETVRAVLEGYGYSVLTKLSPSDGLKLLETTHVDLIISDVMFSGTEGDGFSFFEKVQKVPHLKKVPFILMSGMHESFFVRTGIQLGVDDYLTKPVDPDMLAAVVEGKLKKYRSLRESD